MIRPSIRTGCALAATAATFVFAAPAASADGPQAAASTARCSLANYYTKLGATYAQRLSVRNTSCRTGRNVAKAHYRCWRANGRRGRCHRRVLGYACSESRSAGAAQFVGNVVCRRGTRRVYYVYSQNF